MQLLSETSAVPSTFWAELANRYLLMHRFHYNDVIMGAITTQINSLTIVYSIIYSDADQRKHQSSASLAFVRGIHRGPVNSPDKWPVTRKMFPFNDVFVFARSRYLTSKSDINTLHKRDTMIAGLYRYVDGGVALVPIVYRRVSISPYQHGLSLIA